MDALVDTEKLLRLLPPIRRARLWRLYGERGERFLDLWMDGGRSLLGAKGTGVGTVAKAAIDVGLTRPFPSIRERRLERLLLARWPGYAAARFYRNYERSLAAVAAALGDAAGDLAVYDPARMREGPAAPEDEPRSVGLVRPFDAAPDGAVPDRGAFRAAFPILPCPDAFSPSVVFFRDRADADRAGSGDLLPPLLFAAATRALVELDRYVRGYDEGHWRRVDRRLGAFFARKGPYLYARRPIDAHEAFFRAALAGGALVSPDPGLPSIVPGDFDDGELVRLAKALETAGFGST